MVIIRTNSNGQKSPQLQTKFVEIGLPVLEKIFENVFTIYGHGGPGPKPSLSYDTAQIKLYELECKK